MTWWALLGRRRIDSSWYRKAGRLQPCLRWDEILIARVKGRRGAYEVFGTRRALDCTCGAPRLPCPHVEAVRDHFDENPAAFLDLRPILGPLVRAPGGEEGIERLLLSAPGRVIEAVERRNSASILEALSPLVSQRTAG